MPPRLRIHNLTKRFGSFTANDSVTFEAERGEIHALVGENGAGKTTLMKCLFGLHKPDAGAIEIDGIPVRIGSPREAAMLGIGMVHQHFMLVPGFPAFMNVVLGEEPRRGVFFDRDQAVEDVRELVDRFALDIDPEAPTYSLPVGLQQRVEILKLLYRKAEILIFDEPTAVLSPQEVEGLFGILRSFRDQGKTVIFIAHKLSEVLALSDRITVMRRGRCVGTVRVEDTDENLLSEMMVGRSISVKRTLDAVATGGELLSVENLWARNDRGLWALRGVNLSVKRGEIVGIAGVMGNGQPELVDSIVGLRGTERGRIGLKGMDATDKSVRERRELGVAYIPEDRLSTGLAPIGTLWENLVMGHENRPELKRGRFIRRGAVFSFAKNAISEYGISPPNHMTQAGTLSGGNMQKAVLARELAHGAPLIVVSQPTRGVDVNGTVFIYDKLLEHRANGGVLLVSSDLDEILNLSDRICVLYGGEIVANLPRAEATSELLGRYMLKGA